MTPEAISEALRARILWLRELLPKAPAIRTDLEQIIDGLEAIRKELATWRAG